MKDLIGKLQSNADPNCFWCGSDDIIHDPIKCSEEFKKAIESLFGGRKLNKKESIRMRNSKR